MRDWRGEFFKAEDFGDWAKYETADDTSPTVDEWCANKANAILKEHLDKAPTMSARFHKNCIDEETGLLLPCGVWEAVTENPIKGHNKERFTHQAKLICIEEIKCQT